MLTLKRTTPQQTTSLLPTLSRRMRAGDNRHWAIVGVLLLAVLSYASTLSLQFFWEDPFDIGQVERYSYWEALFTPISNSYYRPLTMLIFKVLRESSVGHLVWTYHLPIVGAHVLAVLLCLKLAQAVFGRFELAIVAAGLFALYPVSYEAIARATTPHTWTLALALGTLLLHLRGREQNHWGKLAMAQVLAVIAIGIHENGVLIAPMLVLLELYLLRRNRIARLSGWICAAFGPVSAFIVIWLNIPKPVVDTVQIHPGLLEFAYVSQGLSFPLAWVISQLGGLGLDGRNQALLVCGLSVLVLCLGAGHRRWPELLLCLSLWLLCVSLAWLTRSMGYLETSPRVLYFGSFAAAWAWALALWPEKLPLSSKLSEPTPPTKTFTQYFRWGLTSWLLLQSAWTLGQQVQLYQSGSRLMSNIIAAGQNNGGGRKLFLNVPDRFEYRRALYPLGYWGMLLAPVSQDLSDFVWLASPADQAYSRTQTRSLTTRPLVDREIKASPFEVNTRGVEAYDQSRLVESVLWANETYVTNYHTDGNLTLQPVGEIRARPTAANIHSTQTVGEIRNIATLISGTFRIEPAAEMGAAPASVAITLTWQAISPAKPTDTIFVHLVGPDGQVLAQADGDSLDGLIRPSAWQPGQIIIDQRTIVLTGPLPTPVQLRVGMYSRENGQRYMAVSAAGIASPENALVIAQGR